MKNHGFSTPLLAVLVAFFTLASGMYLMNIQANPKLEKNTLEAPSELTPTNPVVAPTQGKVEEDQPSQSSSTSVPQPLEKATEPISNSGTLTARFSVVFVDKVTGKTEPISNFPFIAIFGPECNDYEMEPGEQLESKLVGLCTWRQKLLEKKVSLKTDSSGVAIAQIELPPVPKNITEPLAKSWIADAITPTFNYYKEPYEAGWDYNKFEVRFDIEKSSETGWRILVEYIGYRGDVPTSFRN